jgi:hypothetical protein
MAGNRRLVTSPSMGSALSMTEREVSVFCQPKESHRWRVLLVGVLCFTIAALAPSCTNAPLVEREKQFANYLATGDDKGVTHNDSGYVCVERQFISVLVDSYVDSIESSPECIAEFPGEWRFDDDSGSFHNSVMSSSVIIKKEMYTPLILELWRRYPTVSLWMARRRILDTLDDLYLNTAYKTGEADGSKERYNLPRIKEEPRYALRTIMRKVIDRQTHIQTKLLMTVYSAVYLNDPVAVRDCVEMLDSNIPEHVFLGILGASWNFQAQFSPSFSQHADKLLGHQNYWVRLYAAYRLARAGDKRALKTLLECAKETLCIPLQQQVDPALLVPLCGDKPHYQIAAKKLTMLLGFQRPENGYELTFDWDDCSLEGHLHEVAVLEDWLTKNWDRLEFYSGNSDWRLRENSK